MLLPGVEVGTVRLKCLSTQQHNTMSAAKDGTWSALFSGEHAINHEDSPTLFINCTLLQCAGWVSST